MPAEHEATTQKIDYNTPPLVAVTGVVRLRNGEEVPVRCNVFVCEYAGENEHAAVRKWHAGSVDGEPYLAHHVHDIVAQVSVGPTGPGVYEDWQGAVCHLRRDDEQWVDQNGARYDEWGRHVIWNDRPRSTPLHHLRRRIGDLPVTMTASEARQVAIQTHEGAKRSIAEDRERVARELCSREGVVMHGDRDRAIRELVASAATDGGSTGIPKPDPPFLRRDTIAHPGPEPDQPQQPVAPEWHYTNQPTGMTHDELLAYAKQHRPPGSWYEEASPSYSAAEGRAVMDALMPPQQFPQSRRLSAWEMAAGTLWSARVVAGVDPSQTVVMMVDVDGEVSLGFVKGAPDELTVVRRDHVYVGKVAVSRDDLRVLFDRASSLAGLDYDADQRTYPEEAEYGALSRAAAALDETLPGWMTEHARKEGWAK